VCSVLTIVVREGEKRGKKRGAKKRGQKEKGKKIIS
jgi:hypothetical protein